MKGDLISIVRKSSNCIRLDRKKSTTTTTKHIINENIK